MARKWSEKLAAIFRDWVVLGLLSDRSAIVVTPRIAGPLDDS